MKTKSRILFYVDHFICCSLDKNIWLPSFAHAYDSMKELFFPFPWKKCLYLQASTKICPREKFELGSPVKIRKYVHAKIYLPKACKNAPLPKICHAYPTMMKLDTVMPYLKNIIPWVLVISAFFYRKLANFAVPSNTDIDCILIHNF